MINEVVLCLGMQQGLPEHRKATDLHQVNISLYSWLRAGFEPVFKATTISPTL